MFKVWLLDGGKGGSVMMEFIARVGVSLVMVLLYAVWLRFVFSQWWVLVAILPACIAC